ncbi:hypothetical protein [Mycoplasma sp. ATU-Cv-508]|uniref:hypothetical protein n=1 Tax=Mycoplasma sp. ATU-Cv-508 TaxID=2048001 RepID=UPI000FDE79B0
MRLSDSRENQADVQINSPLISSDPSEMLVDVRGQAIVHRDKLQWKFYVSTSQWPPDLDRFGYALPQKLHNGQYLHITLGARQGLNNISVRGFQNREH